MRVRWIAAATILAAIHYGNADMFETGESVTLTVNDRCGQRPHFAGMRVPSNGTRVELRRVCGG